MTEMATGIRSALKLGVSLILSWSVALGIRILLPRSLGPETFGIFNFADAFTTAWCVLLFLGADTYIRKEVPLRPEHAGDFMGGITVVRVVGTVLLWLLMVGILVASHKSTQVLELVTVFSAVQLVVTHNQTLSALLQSVHRVDAVAVWSVVVKVVWGGLVVLALVTGHGALGAAAGLLASELVRAVALHRACSTHLKLQWRLDKAHTWRVLRDGLPYFLTALASTLMGKLDITLLGYLSTDAEVGWYSAGQSIASLSLMLTPVIAWVLLPLSSHAAARSKAELGELMRRALEMVLQLAIPIVLFLAMFGDTVTLVLFGVEFAPTTNSIRILSSMFLFSYVTSVSASFLVRLDKGWLVTQAALWGLGANVLLNLALIPLLGPALGRGGAGVAAGISAALAEALVAAIMFGALRGENFDARGTRNILKTLACCAVMVGVHLGLLHLELWWPVRLGVELLLYPALVLGIGAVSMTEVRALVAQARSKKGGG